jgi:hypothetical protein
MKKLNIIKRTITILLLISIVMSVNSCKKEDLVPSYEIKEANIYVSLNGDDENPGTIDLPVKTWAKAVELAYPGALIYIRGGIYEPLSQSNNIGLTINKIGEEDKYIRFWAYPGEDVIWDCSKIITENTIKGINFSGNYWHFKGFHVVGIKQPKTGEYCRSFSVSESNYNIFENLDIHNNEGVGMYIGESSNNNLILNCDFHENFDPYSVSNGENYAGGYADGCHISIREKNTYNTIRGCRFWLNSDDGLDMWKSEGVVYVDSCWSFKNGYNYKNMEPSGDGTGFKLGRTDLEIDEEPQRIIKNCIAYGNKNCGFDQNGAKVIISLYNNVAYKNGFLGFYLSPNYSIKHNLYNNIAYQNNISELREIIINDESIQVTNTWNGFDANDNDFLSLNDQDITKKRDIYGKLIETSFLHLQSTSILINAGTDVGIQFIGSAPDIGSFEAN